MYLQSFSNCLASHGHQVQADRSDDRLAGVVESPNHMDHSGGQRALLQLQIVELSSSSTAPRAVEGSSRRLELQRPSVIQFAGRVPVSRSPVRDDRLDGGSQSCSFRACSHMNLSSSARELGLILQHSPV